MKKAKIEDIKIGAKLKIYYNENNINNKNIEIRAIIDEENIVYKTWLKRKKYWNYVLIDNYMIRTLIKHDYLFLR